MSSLDSAYYENLLAALSECDGQKTGWGVTYSVVYLKQLQFLSCSIYACIVSLVLAVIFLIFKSDEEELTKFQRLKIRVLVSILFVTTICTFIALLGFVANIFDFYMINNADVCNKEGHFGNGGKYAWPGNGTTMISFVVAIALMM
jgi:hypothetical protein